MVGYKNPPEDFAAPDVSVPTPKATSICCPTADPTKRQNTKKETTKLSFFKFFSERFSRDLDVIPAA
jgi:hypothetical protein